MAIADNILLGTGGQTEVVNPKGHQRHGQMPLDSYIKDNICLPQIYCNPKHVDYKRTLEFCKKSLGWDAAEVKDNCSRWHPLKCPDVKECSILVSNKVNKRAGGKIQASFSDIVVKIPQTKYFIRLPPLYPKSCASYGNVGTLYEHCPCCFCGERGAAAPGGGAGAGSQKSSQVLQPGSYTCVPPPVGESGNRFYFIYFPKNLSRVMEAKFGPQTIKIRIGEGESMDINPRNVVEAISQTDLTPYGIIKLLHHKEFKEKPKPKSSFGEAGTVVVSKDNIDTAIRFFNPGVEDTQSAWDQWNKSQDLKNFGGRAINFITSGRVASSLILIVVLGLIFYIAYAQGKTR